MLQLLRHRHVARWVELEGAEEAGGGGGGVQLGAGVARGDADGRHGIQAVEQDAPVAFARRVGEEGGDHYIVEFQACKSRVRRAGR